MDFEARRQFPGLGIRDFVLDARRLEGPRQEGPLILLSIVDVTHVKHAMEEQKADLARSNQELEQFAHAASHDLREPLRMVVSFLQLISERYKGKLDQEADEWIHYAVDGAERMQRLIADLLAYAAVGSGQAVTEVNLADVLQEVRANLAAPIRETSAVIESGPLPTAPADRVEMVQLFQNLIGNAIKFHGSKPPHVRVAAKQEDDVWQFTVADNGIGIAPEHRDRIFSMFERLNDRSRYPGTGIGLAICRKIVERLGGRIWVESTDGNGTAFNFTLPAVVGNKLKESAEEKSGMGKPQRV